MPTPVSRFLIADDHVLFVQAVAAQLLKRFPSYECRFVHTLTDLQAANLRDFSLLLVDLSFDDGEALSWLSSNSPSNCLILTSASEEAVVTLLLSLETNGVVHKSDDVSCLLLGIETVLAGGSYLSPRIREINSAIKRRPDALHKILSAREYAVLKLIARGLPNDEIASELGLRASSVSDHKKNLMAKLEVHSLPELMRCAIDRGLTRA